MCVPVAYVAGLVAAACCANFESIDEHDMELHKVQFYYPKVQKLPIKLDLKLHRCTQF